MWQRGQEHATSRKICFPAQSINPSLRNFHNTSPMAVALCNSQTAFHMASSLSKVRKWKTVVSVRGGGAHQHRNAIYQANDRQGNHSSPRWQTSDRGCRTCSHGLKPLCSHLALTKFFHCPYNGKTLQFSGWIVLGLIECQRISANDVLLHFLYFS